MEYGLIGKKLGHSFSKEIHESIGKYPYELIELDESEFEDFITKKDFKAINVTIPYKEKVIPYLDYISSEAKSINAVNVVINDHGVLKGYNTDYFGFLDLLRYFEIEVKNKTVLILGTGGTSKTVTEVLNDLNASKIYYASTSKKENTFNYSDLESIKNEIEIIVNTTPREMYPNNDQEILSLDGFDKLESVIDVIYNPLATNLILKAEEKKLKCCNGLYMLISQAFYAMELFLNTKFDAKQIEKYYRQLLKKKRNYVLIGMPTSGKTTIGQLLSKKTHREFIDTDEEIKKILGMDISEYFINHSEEEFRDIESKVIEKYAKMNNLVISTGGGSILRKNNIKYLKQNGCLFFLDRNLEKLQVTSSRPLAKNNSDLANLYSIRHPLYLKAMDYRIDGNKGIGEIVNTIASIDLSKIHKE